MVKRNVGIGLVFVGLLSLPLLGVRVQADSATVPSGSYGVSLEVREVSDGGSYVVTAEITDALSGELLSAPQILTMSGEEATVETIAEIGGVEIALRLGVQVSDDSLSYRFEALHGETVRVLQTGEIHH